MNNMRLLVWTFNDPSANLALDEALLNLVDAASVPGVLRLWEPSSHFVVVGRGSQLEREVHWDQCLRLSIPVQRRVSGGAAIVTGPGCLMYAVVLPMLGESSGRDIQRIHDNVMARHVAALDALNIEARREGICDLIVDGRKVSGNSLRCVRNAVLYHGTFLYNFDLELISRCLRIPPRMPEYRRGRSHAEFVGSIPTSRAELEAALREVWQAETLLTNWPAEQTAALVQSKYARPDWIQSGRRS